MKIQNLNQRQTKWTLYLFIFDFTLKHVPGVKMEKTDRLSRRLDLKVGVEKNNKNQKLIKKKWMRGMMKVVVEGLKMILVEKIKKVKRKR